MGEIIFVGTGNAFNNGGRASQAFWIKTENFNILIDCGPTTLYRLKQLNLSPDNLDGIFFTHFHGDHTAGLAGLDLTLALDYKRVCPIVYGGPEGLRKQIDKLFEANYSGFYPDYSFERQIIEFIPNQNYELINKKLSIFNMETFHSKNSIGYRLQIEDKLIAITGDTGWCDEIAKLSENVDILICECSYFNKNSNEKHISHEILHQKRELLKAKKIVLVHPGEEVINNKDKLIFELADDGMTLKF